MNNLASEIRRITSLDKLFRFADMHVRDLKDDPNLLHLLKNKRRELKRIEWLHFDKLQYLS